MAEDAGKGHLLDNDIRCGKCGAMPKRTKLRIVDRTDEKEFFPLSWWQTYEFWRQHGMGKACNES